MLKQSDIDNIINLQHFHLDGRESSRSVTQQCVVSACFVYSMWLAQSWGMFSTFFLFSTFNVLLMFLECCWKFPHVCYHASGYGIWTPCPSEQKDPLSINYIESQWQHGLSKLTRGSFIYCCVRIHSVHPPTYAFYTLQFEPTPTNRYMQEHGDI